MDKSLKSAEDRPTRRLQPKQMAALLKRVDTQKMAVL